MPASSLLSNIAFQLRFFWLQSLVANYLQSIQNHSKDQFKRLRAVNWSRYADCAVGLEAEQKPPMELEEATSPESNPVKSADLNRWPVRDMGVAPGAEGRTRRSWPQSRFGGAGVVGADRDERTIKLNKYTFCNNSQIVSRKSLNRNFATFRSEFALAKCMKISWTFARFLKYVFASTPEGCKFRMYGFARFGRFLQHFSNPSLAKFHRVLQFKFCKFCKFRMCESHGLSQGFAMGNLLILWMKGLT